MTLKYVVGLLLKRVSQYTDKIFLLFFNRKTFCQSSALTLLCFRLQTIKNHCRKSVKLLMVSDVFCSSQREITINLIDNQLQTQEHQVFKYL